MVAESYPSTGSSHLFGGPIRSIWSMIRWGAGGPPRAQRTRSHQDLYDAYRKQIEHEDELIGMRNGWLIGGEAFLFAAYSALLTLPSSGHLEFTKAAELLFTELPIIGIALALLAFCAVCAALWCSRQLRQGFDRCYSPPEGYPAVMSRGPRWLGHFVAFLVPLGMVTAWTVVIVSRIS
jgi:hypothetical protein